MKITNSENPIMTVKRRKLKPYHVRSVELRFKGYKYAQICEAINREFGTNIKVQTLRWWFMSNGILDDECYKYMRREAGKMNPVWLDIL